MTVKEPVGTYTSTPTTSVMRGRLIKTLENEKDVNFIHSMYWLMTQLKKEQSTPKSQKYSLSALGGILAFDDNSEMSYDDMRLAYMKEKYSL